MPGFSAPPPLQDWIVYIQFSHPHNICSSCCNSELRTTGLTEKLAISRDGGEWLFQKCSLAKVRECSQNTKPSKSSTPLLSFVSIFRNVCYICALFLYLNLISNSRMYFYTLLCVNLLRKYPPTSVTQTRGITHPSAQLEHVCEHQHFSWCASFLPTDVKHSDARRKDQARNFFHKERG